MQHKNIMAFVAGRKYQAPLEDAEKDVKGDDCYWVVIRCAPVVLIVLDLDSGSRNCVMTFSVYVWFY